MDFRVVQSSSWFTEFITFQQQISTFYIDVSNFRFRSTSSADIEKELSELQQYYEVFNKSIVGLKLSGGNFSKSYEIQNLLIPLLQPQKMRLQHLIYLNISFVDLSPVAFDAISAMMHPTKGNYKIKVLFLTKCNLGPRNIARLFQNLCGNNIIEEIYISGNNCTDDAVAQIVSFMLEHKNVVRRLGFGNNSITHAGIRVTFISPLTE